MLLIDDGKEERQITADEFVTIVGIPADIYAKLKKSPVFEINPELTKPDKLNGGVTAPAGKGSKPYFHMRIKGITHTLRYAKQIIPDRQNPRLSTYDPKRVMFFDQVNIYTDIDEAVFMLALPACGDSPIKKKDWHYRLQNKEKQAIQITERAGKIGKALSMINTELSDNDVILIAKGIYARNTEKRLIPNPSSKNKTLAEIRADLTQLALGDPDLFLNCADDDINTFYGMILDAVDRRIFSVRSQNNKRSWYWEHGQEKNQHIVDIGPSQTDFEALRTCIESNPNKFYRNIIEAQKNMSNQENLKSFLQNQKEQGGGMFDILNPIPGSHQVIGSNGKVTEAPKAKETDEVIHNQPNKTENDGVDDDDIRENDGPGHIFKPEDFAGNNPQFVAPANFEESNQLLAKFNGGKKAAGDKNGYFWRLVKEGKVNADNVAAMAGEALAYVKPQE